MQETIITKIKTDLEQRLLDMQETFTKLSTNPDTKDIFLKLTTMDSQVLFGMFHEVFIGFDSLEDAEHTCNVLINTCLDDIGIYLTTKIIGEEATDRMRKITGREDIAYLETEAVTFTETDNWMGQSDLLEYIDRQEKKDIENTNSHYIMKNKMNKGNKSKTWSFMGDIKKRYGSFNTENIQLLDPDILEHFGL